MNDKYIDFDRVEEEPATLVIADSEQAHMVVLGEVVTLDIKDSVHLHTNGTISVQIEE